MIFSSPTFLFLFLPLVLLAHRLAPGILRNPLLLLASLFFYTWGDGAHLAVLLVSIALNYSFARVIAGLGPGRWASLALVFGLGLNLALLGYFKVLVEQLGVQSLPLGVSFFTLQGMSYLMDVAWGLARVETNVIRLALYISLFPQLIAGPIVRYHEIEGALKERTLELSQAGQGARRFIVGLAKKVLLADPLATYVALLFHSQAEPTMGLAWLGALCFALQVYCDFSGYSDMAIGIGQMMGFRLPENFRYPYLSRSIKEFWSRWHMTLTGWLTTYLMMPATRVVKGQKGMRLVILGYFLLMGIWHASSWNFVCFGLLHGMMVVLESGPFLRPAQWVSRLPKVLGWLYCHLVVLVSMVFFRAETLEQSGQFLAAMVGQGAPEGTFFVLARLDSVFWLTMLVAALTSLPIAPRIQAWLTDRGHEWVEVGWYALLLGLSWMWVAASGHQSFVYFQY